MTMQMWIAVAITVIMIVMIMSDKFAFGAPPLICCVLLVLVGLRTVQEAFAGFVNNSVVMIAGFMGIMAALQKTSLIGKVKDLMLNLAQKGGYKSYVLLVIIAMLAGSVFGAGATACYVLVLSLVTTIPYNKELPPSKLVMPMGFATNQPLIPINVALHFGIMLQVLETAGFSTAGIGSLKFSLVNVIMNVAFLAWCLIGYRLLPDHEIAASDNTAASQEEKLEPWKEKVIYACFIVGVLGMVFQTTLGNAGYVVPAACVAVLVSMNIVSFKEAMHNIGAPVVLMMAGVVGVADALAGTGFIDLVGNALASVLKGITKDMDAGDYEAHRKYLDVQVLLQGDETVVWADIADLTETEAYNSDTDKAMYAGEGSAVGIRPGMCYICWPHDAHKACRHAVQPAQYRKAVIKLEIPDVK